MSPDIVYQILTGRVDLEKTVVPANVEIPDVFAKGTECGRLHNEMYKARVRLENRLGTTDDSDIHCMMECMEAMSRYLAKEMYRLGALYGKPERKRIMIPLQRRGEKD